MLQHRDLCTCWISVNITLNGQLVLLGTAKNTHSFIFLLLFLVGVKVAGKVGPDFSIPSRRFYLILGDPPYIPKPNVRYNLSSGSCFGVSALWDVLDAEEANQGAHMCSAQTISTGSSRFRRAVA